MNKYQYNYRCCFLVFLTILISINSYCQIHESDSVLLIQRNGIRVNLVDRKTDIVNGVALSTYSEYDKVNGVNIGLLMTSNWQTNGLDFGLLSIDAGEINGVAFSPIGLGASKINGFSFASLGLAADTLNGFFVCPLIGISYWNTEKITLVNGFTIGGEIGANALKMNGVSLSLFNNHIDSLNGLSIAVFNVSKSLNGVQLGLLIVVEDRKYFKRIPIMNINFTKNANK